jgi:serine phosphatase RsbU (regulator of sigma subunit)
MKFKFFLTTVFVLYLFPCFSQTKEMDSLKLALRNAKHDTTQIQILLKLSDKCENINRLQYTQSALQIINKLLKDPKSVNNKKLYKQKIYTLRSNILYYQFNNDTNNIINTYKNILLATRENNDTNNIVLTNLHIGDFYNAIGNIPKSLESYEKGLELSKQFDYKKGIGLCLSSIGRLYEDQKNEQQSIAILQKAKMVMREIKDSVGLANLNISLGRLYGKIHNTKKAEEYFNEALFFYKNSNHPDASDQVPIIYRNIGRMHFANKDILKARSNFQNALSVAEANNDEFQIAYTLLVIADTYIENSDYTNALTYISNSLKIYEKLNYESGKAAAYSSFANVYFKQKNYKSAKEYSNRSLGLIKKEFYTYQIRDAEFLAFNIDSASENFSDAYLHYKNYILSRDKLNSDDVRKAAINEKFQSEYEKQKAVDKAEHEKQTVLANAEKKKQNIIIISVIVALLLLFLITLIIFRSLKLVKKQKVIIEIKNRETVEQKHLVEEKQKEIIESITYAKRLQEAILPPQEFINKYVPDNFILYKPKDLVAGDFYWAERINDLFFIAAADSTGHGVPGAMVSVVCSNALNRTIKEFGLTETGKILDKTRELVLETFEKSTSEVKDGMDISLLCINSKNKSIFWSGANNPLWYIQDNQLKEIKADKQPIGKTEYPKPFTSHKIEYVENTTFYLFTDGFADQFGGPNGKKFKYKQFSDLLLKHKDLSQLEQSNIINTVFTKWKGDLEQVDDVCVIGIKI